MSKQKLAEVHDRSFLTFHLRTHSNFNCFKVSASMTFGDYHRIVAPGEKYEGMVFGYSFFLSATSASMNNIHLQ
jgi:hypothetical protein